MLLIVYIMYMMGLLSLQKQLAQSRYGIGRILWLEGLPFRLPYP